MNSKTQEHVEISDSEQILKDHVYRYVRREYDLNDPDFQEALAIYHLDTRDEKRGTSDAEEVAKLLEQDGEKLENKKEAINYLNRRLKESSDTEYPEIGNSELANVRNNFASDVANNKPVSRKGKGLAASTGGVLGYFVGDSFGQYLPNREDLMSTKDWQTAMLEYVDEQSAMEISAEAASSDPSALGLLSGALGALLSIKQYESMSRTDKYNELTEDP